MTIIGAGLMGHGIAQVFAVHGYPVRMTDSNEVVLNAAKDHVRVNLTNMVKRGIKIG
ncbi:MAG: 3-hydroxyacyl-CoA dehydrogenase, partial [Chloroflexi bacterium]|nr:3-hydroxyacyl-CoA dehydrogenase [Chloroflexota bacterium]